MSFLDKLTPEQKHYVNAKIVLPGNYRLRQMQNNAELKSAQFDRNLNKFNTALTNKYTEMKQKLGYYDLDLEDLEDEDDELMQMNDLIEMLTAKEEFDQLNAENAIVMYGADWCGACVRLKD